MFLFRRAAWVVLLFTSNVCAQQISKVEQAYIERVMREHYKPSEPGAVILIAKNGKPVFRKAYGMANVQLELANSPEFVFCIGSMSKQFTAVSMLQLVQQGKLSLDDEIKKHLPWYNAHDRTITVRHLLSHTSGITSYTAKSDFGEKSVVDHSKREIAEYFMNDPLLFEPGSEWSYSNSGYAIANLIIEEVSGLSFEDYLQQHIFDPLGMSKTSVGDHQKLIPHAVSGYWKSDGEYKNAAYLNWKWAYGGGQLLSCVDDLLKWDESLYTDTLVDRELLAMAWNSGIIPNDRMTQYGFGWKVGEFEGVKIVQHGGAINGFRSFGVRLPSSHHYVVILSNTSKDPSIALEIALKLAGKPLAEPPLKDTKASDLVDFVGHYRMHRLGSRIAKQYGDEKVFRHITIEGDTLVAQVGDRRKRILNRVDADLFFIKAPRTFVRFHRKDEKVTSITAYAQPNFAPISPEQRVDFDLIIRGGMLIDGTGAPRKLTSIAVDNGKISQVGVNDEATAIIDMDATGMIVAPGFIDAHNHTEIAIAEPENRLNEAFVRQGVSTIVGGADGSLSPKQIRELVEAYEENGVGTNVAFYVGHNAIRSEIVRKNPRVAPTANELREMKALVEEGMKLGAVGLSTGLMYPPGMYSDTDEVVALAKVAAEHGGIYDSHVRDPVHELIESDREVIEIARRAAISSKIGHLKAVGLENAGRIRDVIDLVNQASEEGLTVVSDQYPYDGAATAPLRELIVVPPAIRNQEGFELKKALANKKLRNQIRRASEHGSHSVNGGFSWIKATGYSSKRIVHCSEFPELVGKYPSELAAEEGMKPFEKIVQLLIDAEKPILITLGAIQETDVRELLVQSWNMIASDGAFVDPESRQALGHPRSTGTFPRVLGHYVRELELLSLEEAIRKMTSLPADFLRLPKRGRIRKGMAADVVVFDPDKIQATSTWTNPNSMAIGVRDLLVNGEFVLRDSRLTNTASGRYLESD